MKTKGKESSKPAAASSSGTRKMAGDGSSSNGEREGVGKKGKGVTGKNHQKKNKGKK